MGVVLTQISYVNNITKQTQHIIQTELLSLFVLRHFFGYIERCFPNIISICSYKSHNGMRKSTHTPTQTQTQFGYFFFYFFSRSIWLRISCSSYIAMLLSFFFFLSAHSLCLFSIYFVNLLTKHIASYTAACS